jgi:hypothetical protein
LQKRRLSRTGTLNGLPVDLPANSIRESIIVQDLNAQLNSNPATLHRDLPVDLMKRGFTINQLSKKRRSGIIAPLFYVPDSFEEKTPTERQRGEVTKHVHLTSSNV